jgi:hypothetical protein
MDAPFAEGRMYQVHKESRRKDIRVPFTAQISYLDLDLDLDLDLFIHIPV